MRTARFLIVLILLAGLALPATSSDWGLTASIGLGASVQHFELDRGLYVSIAALIDGDRVATAHTSRGLAIRMPREIDYEVRFIPRNIKNLQKVSLLVSPTGETMEMEGEDVNGDGQFDRFVAILRGRNLPRDDFDLHFELTGRFDRETVKILFITSSSDRRGTTRQPIPVTGIDCHPGLAELGPQEFAHLHLRRLGWVLLDEYLQQPAPVPANSPTPAAPSGVSREELAQTLSQIENGQVEFDATGLEAGLSEIATAIREGNASQAQLLELLAGNQDLLQRILEEMVATPPVVERVEETPCESSPPTLSTSILRLTLADCGRQLKDGERLLYTPGLRLVAHMSQENGVITSSLELPGKVSDSQTFAFSGGSEPIWFRGLTRGVWKLSVNYSDGGQSQTVVVHLEVR